MTGILGLSGTAKADALTITPSKAKRRSAVTSNGSETQISTTFNLLP